MILLIMILIIIIKVKKPEVGGAVGNIGESR